MISNNLDFYLEHIKSSFIKKSINKNNTKYNLNILFFYRKQKFKKKYL